MNAGWRLTKWVGGIVFAATFATIVLPGHRSVTLGAGVMALLAVVLAEIGGVAYRLAGERDSAWDRVRDVPEPKTERPPDLERLERRFGWGQYGAGDFNYRVRPTLRRLAAQRLRESHSIDVEVDSGAARELVTPELWDHVIAKQPPDSERVVRTADIARMVDEIERL